MLTAFTPIHVLTASPLQVLTASTALLHERESREEVEAEEGRVGQWGQHSLSRDLSAGGGVEEEEGG